MSSSVPYASRAKFPLVCAVLALLVSLTAACGGSATAGGGGSGSGTVIKLSDPGNAGVLAYAKREKILEERLKTVGARVQWGGSYASFTATIDAVRSRSVNVLEGAISPAVGYLANGRDLRIFAVAERVTDKAAPYEDGLVVKPDSPIRSVRDLVGKRVAVNKAGRGEYLLLLALKQAGIPASQVQRVHLNPAQGASAFATGKVDAWWAIVNAYPEVVAKGARVLVHGRDLPEQDLTIFAARTEVLEANPRAAQVFLDVVRELTEQEKRDPRKFQNVFLDKGPTALSGARLDVELAKARYQNVPRPVTDADGRHVTAVAGLFQAEGVLPNAIKPEDVLFKLGSQ
ncbi:aliphatic sulfonate ABC transporter substrate-binding protein [Actinomadura spongiicola]|uniref:Aliphatic sulfonate ABC transporter substrate-binding protein n=1 Tax=Actinomadura spongiicola TaxID=2303421 RepID=A0A372GPU0_9ACTN|nr:ABC transporter substrate-binding protein [Actinomadura spongiicola]RFS87396.1 aliphatic sulfonate ABC transporter substrate-binding protein [Actinomadura spongiicola]